MRFADSLRAAAGRAFLLLDPGALEETLLSLDGYRSAKTVCSLVPGVERHNVDLATFDDPRSLGQVGLSVLEGSLGVAENGAVWLALDDTMHRGLLFLSEHVVLVLDKERIVDTMQGAYEELDVTGTPFGCFVSGPSKTADIEQALVVGAHGPRSLTVVLT
jgi:L-lactate dehydrogenase complex protein LldG